MLGKWRLALVLVMFCAGPAAAQAPAARDTYGLLPLLIDLPGWTAEGPQVEDRPGDVDGVAAQRIYRRGEAELTVGILAVQMNFEAVQRMTLPPGTDSRTVRQLGFTAQIEPINGFAASRTIADDGGEGLIMVVLSEGAMLPALFAMGFNKITLEEAMEIARRFDWTAMRTQLRAVRAP